MVAIKYYKNILPKRPKSDFLNVAATMDATKTPGHPVRDFGKKLEDCMPQIETPDEKFNCPVDTPLE